MVAAVAAAVPLRSVRVALAQPVPRPDEAEAAGALVLGEVRPVGKGLGPLGITHGTEVHGQNSHLGGIRQGEVGVEFPLAEQGR